MIDEMTSLGFLSSEPVPPPAQRKIDTQGMYNLAQAGCTEREIAAYYGMSVAEWEALLAGDDKLAALLQQAADAGRAALRFKQFSMATKGDDKMLKHLGEHMLGQSAKVTLAGDRNNPLEIKTSLSDTDREIISRYLEQKELLDEQGTT